VGRDHERSTPTGAGSPAPPAGAERLLRVCLPAGVVGASIGGDLRQEFEERAEHAPAAARRWYRRQALRLASRYAWDRARQLASREPPGGAAPPASKVRALAMDTLLQDIRFGIRTLSSNRAFTAVAVVTLALGIGANAAMFSVVNAVLLRPLEYPEPHELVAVKRFDLSGEPESSGNTTPGNFHAWMERAGSFAAMAAVGGDLTTLTGRDEARRLAGVRSAGSLHEVLGVPPLFGRGLTLADDTPDSNAVVISHALWQGLYGDNRDMLGDTLMLDNVPHTVVGVMAPDFTLRHGFYGGRAIDFWGPSGWSSEYRRNHNNYAHEVIARLAPGVTIEQAQQEMESIATALREQYPEENRNHGVQIVPLRDDAVAGVGPLLAVLMGAVGVLLLIATVNLANLLLARAGAREQEVAVRKAVGATPGRLARQLLTESVLLSLLGGVVGLALAFLLTDVVTALVPANVPYLDRVAIDPLVLTFTFVLATGAGVAFGVIPALRLSRHLTAGALAGRGRASRRTAWTWSALVIAEVALSVVLLVGAGLLLHSFVNMLRVDPGFRPERVMTFVVSTPGEYPPERRLAFWRELRDELAALPGVTAAAVANQLPAEPNRVSGWFNYIDHPVEITDRSHLVPYRLVSTGYFEALGIPVLRGRGFQEGDGNEPIAAIVNQAAAAAFWPDGDPLGDRIGMGSLNGEPWYPPATVVGVVGDVRNAGLTESTRPAIYFPVEMASGWTNLTFALRTTGPPEGILRAARDRVRDLDEMAAVFNEITVEQMLARQTAPTRAILQLIGAFAGLGLAMAAVGVFGVLSYSVSRKTREIGIRTALGADTRRVTAMVVGQAMTRVLAGTVIGVLASLAAGRLLGGMLFEVTPVDPATIAGVVVLLAAVALLASYVPARRATRVDPTIALRAD
jgi:putative ABC transport system permease protein